CAEVFDGLLEVAALAVLLVRLLAGAIDRERDLVDPRSREPPRTLGRKRDAVRAGVEKDVRELRLDVLAHLLGALVEKCFAVVEEVDAHERRPGLVDDASEDLEVEHASLPRPGDTGLRCAARLVAGDVAGRRALDVEPRRQGASIERALRRRLVLAER